MRSTFHNETQRQRATEDAKVNEIRRQADQVDERRTRTVRDELVFY
jgi:hypothetical protein